MNGKPWSKAEVWRLYECAEVMTQPEAALVLGRSLQAINTKCRREGLRWGGGSPTLNTIAKEFKCGHSTVKRMFDLLVDSRRHIPGEGNGHRYRLTDEEADRLRSVLTRTLRMRAAHRAAARKRRR